MDSTQAGSSGPLQDFTYDDVGQIAERVLEYHSKRDGKDRQRIIEVRNKIADFSTSYLKKTEFALQEKTIQKIQESISTIRDSDPDDTIILMTAHQPNLFAYSGILRKIALLKAVEGRISKMAGSKKVVCFYGFADHDFINNKWVRSAEMPAPLKRDGLLRFTVNLDKKDLFLPTNMIGKPSGEKLSSWRSQIEGWISENCSLAVKYAKSFDTGVDSDNILKISKDNFAGFWKYVDDANSNASNLAEFSSFVLSTIANNVLDTPVVFANFSDCFTAFGKEYEWLLSNAKGYSDAVEGSEAALKGAGIDSGLTSDVGELLPVWVRCSCGSKYRLASVSPEKFEGKCMRCDKQASYSYEQLIALLKSSPELFQPKSISMPLAFSRAFDMSFYVTGLGGIGYIIDSKAVSEKLGSPLPPIAYWNVPDNYTRIERLACAWEAGRISKLYGLGASAIPVDSLSDAAKGMLAELSGKIEDGSVAKTAVSERDRQLLEMMPKSLGVQSCAVGYAINIGLGPTYRQWIDFLAGGGKLNEPVGLKSAYEVSR